MRQQTLFQDNASIFGKVYFPRIITPLSNSITNCIGFTIQLITYLVIHIWFVYFLGAEVRLDLLNVITAILIVSTFNVILGLSVGLWLSSLSAKYRDLNHLRSFLIQIWLYATPVVYPLSEVPENYRWLVELNPATFCVEFYRYAFLGVEVNLTGSFQNCLIVTSILFLSGLIVFRRTERNFIDTV